MSADIHPVTAADIPGMLPPVERYRIFADIADFDAARAFRFAHGYGERAGFDMLDKAPPQR